MNNVEWRTVLDNAIKETDSETFAEDWAEDLVDAAIDSEGLDVGLVLSTDGYISLNMWEKGEHSNTESTIEIVRIPAFEDLTKAGEDKLNETPVGFLIEDATWSDFVHTYVKQKLGISDQEVQESRKWVNEKGITWEDFKNWDVTEYNLAVDGVVEKYLQKVRETIAENINNFGEKTILDLD